jgi:hypothetical protein
MAGLVPAIHDFDRLGYARIAHSRKKLFVNRAKRVANQPKFLARLLLTAIYRGDCRAGCGPRLGQG